MTWRYLRTNDCDWRPQNVLCVDTETIRVPGLQSTGHEVEQFRLGVAKSFCMRNNRYGNLRPIQFTNRCTFWDEVERLARPRKMLWIFAHNVGFDSRALGFWQLLDEGRFTRVYKRDTSKGSQSGTRQSEYSTGLLITSDPPTVVEAWTRRGGKIRMVDTLNYWPVSLAQIGDWVGVPKLSMPDPWASDTDWFKYCERDVDILVGAVQKYIAWVKENQLGMFAITLPSQSMHGYRHSMAAKSIVLHDNKEVQQLESDGYYGGEVWCGKIGRAGREEHTKQLSLGQENIQSGNRETRFVHHLDCNSLFPAVMADNLYPRRLLEYRICGDAKRSLVATMGGDCIAECLIHSPIIGIFNRRMSRSGRFTGTFVAVLCGPELEVAKNAGHVVAVRRYARYELADLFSTWVDRWWTLRWTAKLAGNLFESELCKRISNSLYGKWAQKRYEWEECPDMRSADRWSLWTDLDVANNTTTHYRSIAGTVQRAMPKGYHHNAFVAISAFVTSYSRERMRLFRNIAGEREVYYQGIDSLYTSDTGLERLRNAGKVDAGRLGALRLEGAAETAYFAGWGLYQFGNKWTRTALGRGAVECAPGEFEQCNFQRLGDYLSREPTEGISVSHVHKRISASTPVGIVGQDGWVSPMPAQWGDNPAETTNPRGYYSD